MRENLIGYVRLVDAEHHVWKISRNTTKTMLNKRAAYASDVTFLAPNVSVATCSVRT